MQSTGGLGVDPTATNALSGINVNDNKSVSGNAQAGDGTVGTNGDVKTGQDQAADGSGTGVGTGGDVQTGQDQQAQGDTPPVVGDYSHFNGQLANFGLNPADYAKLNQLSSGNGDAISQLIASTYSPQTQAQAQQTLGQFLSTGKFPTSGASSGGTAGSGGTSGTGGSGGVAVGDYSKFNATLPNYGLNPADFTKLSGLIDTSAGSPFSQFLSTAAGPGGGGGGTGLGDIIGGLLGNGGGSTSTNGMPVTLPNGQIVIFNEATGGAGGSGTGGSGTGGTNSGQTGDKPSLLDQLLPYLIAGGGDLAGGLLGNSAAKDAAQIQADAATKAAQLQSDTSANSLAFAKDVYGQEQANNKPFLDAGTNALSQIQSLIAPGGAESQDFVAPTEAQVQQTPGYQLELDAALKALGNQSRGVTSGATLKAADRYASDYADTKYNDATNQALNIFQTNRNNRLSPLTQLAGLGPTAISANNTAGNNAASNVANINQTGTSAINSLNNQTAYQQASGLTSGTNFLTNALQQIASLGVQGLAGTK
jgi:hypothetical protein